MHKYAKILKSLQFVTEVSFQRPIGSSVWWIMKVFRVHCLQSSYLHNGNSYTSKMTSSWWIIPLFHCMYFDGLVQDCSTSSANALEILQSCIKPSIYGAKLCFQMTSWSSWTLTWCSQSSTCRRRGRQTRPTTAPVPPGSTSPNWTHL